MGHPRHKMPNTNSIYSEAVLVLSDLGELGVISPWGVIFAFPWGVILTVSGWDWNHGCFICVIPVWFLIITHASVPCRGTYWAVGPLFKFYFVPPPLASIHWHCQSLQWQHLQYFHHGVFFIFLFFFTTCVGIVGVCEPVGWVPIAFPLWKPHTRVRWCNWFCGISSYLSDLHQDHPLLSIHLDFGLILPLPWPVFHCPSFLVL